MNQTARPDALLRTVQRRQKIWRGDPARALVFAASDEELSTMTSDPLRNLEASRIMRSSRTVAPSELRGKAPSGAFD